MKKKKRKKRKLLSLIKLPGLNDLVFTGLLDFTLELQQFPISLSLCFFVKRDLKEKW